MRMGKLTFLRIALPVLSTRGLPSGNVVTIDSSSILALSVDMDPMPKSTSAADILLCTLRRRGEPFKSRRKKS